ncbi:MAG: hypothetical protein ACLFTE_11030 [Salinivenus sp.]
MDSSATSTRSRPSLQRALTNVTGPAPTRAAIHRVVRCCHQIARASLRQQQRTGSLREDVLGEDIEDLALDAIADLFKRDAQGHFPELRRFFDEVSPQDRPPKALREDLRRLVQSAVTDWLFEAYRAADRSLSNQIRSLKRAARQRDDVRLRRRGRTQWLEVVRADSASGPAQGVGPRTGRPMPLSVLEAHLASAVADACSTDDLLDTAVRTLQSHPTYESAYPLTRLAQAMRAAYARVQATTEHTGPTTYPERPLFRREELWNHLDAVLSTLQDEKRATYVGQGKVDVTTYTAYFRALRDRLAARFVPPGDPDMTHYEALSKHLPHLSKTTYRDEHRARFEYLEQQARTALIDRLEEMI